MRIVRRVGEGRTARFVQHPTWGVGRVVAESPEYVEAVFERAGVRKFQRGTAFLSAVGQPAAPVVDRLERARWNASHQAVARRPETRSEAPSRERYVDLLDSHLMLGGCFGCGKRR